MIAVTTATSEAALTPPVTPTLSSPALTAAVSTLSLCVMELTIAGTTAFPTRSSAVSDKRLSLPMLNYPFQKHNFPAA